MGTIAARDCLRVLELTEQVAAALILATAQAVTLRKQLTGTEPTLLTPQIENFLECIREHSPFLDEDRPLEFELRAVAGLIREGHWEIYSNV